MLAPCTYLELPEDRAEVVQVDDGESAQRVRDEERLRIDLATSVKQSQSVRAVRIGSLELPSEGIIVSILVVEWKALLSKQDTAESIRPDFVPDLAGESEKRRLLVGEDPVCERQWQV